METNRIRQFCIVYETKNLRKAAEILNMTHGALSKSLKVLQEEIGLKLLEPHGRGIEITDQGKEFAQKAQIFLDQEKKLLIQSKPTQEIFKIGSFESFSTHLIGMKFHRYFGDLPLQIHEFSSGQLEQAVSDSVIDVAITYDPVPLRDLEFISLGKISLGIYHRKGFFKNLKFDELPFVAPLIPSVGTPSSAKGLDGWPEHESPRHIRYRVDLMEAGLALVRAGQAAIFLPDFVARAQNEALADEYCLIERKYGAKKIERRTFLVVRSSRLKDKSIKKLIEMIRIECSGL